MHPNLIERIDTHTTRVAALLCVLALASIGCSRQSARAEAPAGYADMQWDEARKVETDSAPPPAFSTTLAAGDQLIWRVSMYGIEIGRISMAVGHPGTAEGRQVIIVRSEFQSTAAAAIFAPLKSVLTTQVDLSTITPVYHRREVETGTVFQWVEITFTPDEFDIDYRRRSAEADSQDRQKVPPGTPLFDVNAMLLAARAWNLEPDQAIVINLMREIYIWSLQIKRAGAVEPVKTRLGEFPALRHDAIGRRLERDGSFDPDEPARQYSYWITDDNKRLPVLIIAKSDYGDVRMELVQHEKAAPQP